MSATARKSALMPHDILARKGGVLLVSQARFCRKVFYSPGDSVRWSHLYCKHRELF